MRTMTGRVLSILKENGDWQTIEDIPVLYTAILDHGFDPDAMSRDELATVASRLKRDSILGTPIYVWDIFYNMFRGANNETN